MVESRNRFDEEFKLMEVGLIESRKIVAEISKESGVTKDLLYQWKSRFIQSFYNNTTYA